MNTDVFLRMVYGYRNLVSKRRTGASGEEAELVAKGINSIIFDRVPEILTSNIKDKLEFT
jgi:hypothetical protein